jgi:hypothetical protein
MEGSVKAGTKRSCQSDLMPRRKRRAETDSFPCELPYSCISYFNERLPSEVLQYIFSFLRERDLVNIGKVCQRFHQIASMETLWKDLFHRVFEINLESLRPSRESSPLLLEGISWKTRFSIMVCTWQSSMRKLAIMLHFNLFIRYMECYNTLLGCTQVY